MKTWTKNTASGHTSDEAVTVGSRESLSTSETVNFATAGFVKNGGAGMPLTRKPHHIESSKPPKGDTDNEPDSETSDTTSGEAVEEDTEATDDQTTWFQAIPGKRHTGSRGIQGVQPKPSSARRSRFSLADKKIPRYPCRNTDPRIQSGADVTIA